jgi:ribonuclease HII
MVEMAKLHPEYGFERNMGYGTAEHMQALRAYGPTPFHRRSFIGKLVGEGRE